MVACSSNQPAAVATPAGTPAVTATVELTPAPNLTPRSGGAAELATAQRFEAQGQLRQAVEEYVAVAARSPQQRQEATLGAARGLLELDRPSEARQLLEPLAAVATTEPAAHYLLARAYGSLSLWPQALAEYDLFIAAAGPVRAYAHYDRANALLQLNRPLDAAVAARTGLDLSVASGQRPVFILFIAQSYERAADTAQAFTWYERLLAESDADGDKALALARMAAIRRAQQDPAAVTLLLRLVGGYPATPQALSELNAALSRDEAIDITAAGLVYYRHNDYTRAEPFFQRQIAAAPNDAASAIAYYYLAAIQESRGQIDAALTNYTLVTQLNPGVFVADDALWWRARIQEARGQTSAAATLLQRIVNEYPQSGWTSEAAFRRGMLAYAEKRYEAAAAAWSDASVALSAGLDKQRLSFWQAKALLSGNQASHASPLLDQLAQSGEDDYYGVRALGLAQGQHNLPKAKVESGINLKPDFDWRAAEAWLSLRTTGAVSEGAWSSDISWARALELWRVGRNSQADAEASDLIEAYAGDAIAMYTMSRRLQTLGRHSMSARAGQRLLRVLNTNPNQGLPRALLSLSYPAAFPELVERHAAQEKVSPLTLLALIRQESFFEPRATSPAGALGLTQVLPGTGTGLAQRLGLVGFASEQLLEADINLRLGAAYLAQQLREFNDELFVAFAAYNAGPSAARRWRAESGTDADLFLESIEFSESRLYVELVAENYAIYRYLYGGESKPTLP